jgi:hypothetical protein
LIHTKLHNITSWKKSCIIALALVLSAGLGVFSPEVKSKEWCEDMKKKDKGEWARTDTTDFVKSCLL